MDVISQYKYFMLFLSFFALFFQPGVVDGMDVISQYKYFMLFLSFLTRGSPIVIVVFEERSSSAARPQTRHVNSSFVCRYTK